MDPKKLRRKSILYTYFHALCYTCSVLQSLMLSTLYGVTHQRARLLSAGTILMSLVVLYYYISLTNVMTLLYVHAYYSVSIKDYNIIVCMQFMIMTISIIRTLLYLHYNPLFVQEQSKIMS